MDGGGRTARATRRRDRRRRFAPRTGDTAKTVRGTPGRPALLLPPPSLTRHTPAGPPAAYGLVGVGDPTAPRRERPRERGRGWRGGAVRAGGAPPPRRWERTPCAVARLKWVWIQCVFVPRRDPTGGWEGAQRCKLREQIQSSIQTWRACAPSPRIVCARPRAAPCPHRRSPRRHPGRGCLPAPPPLAPRTRPPFPHRRWGSSASPTLGTPTCKPRHGCPDAAR